MKVLFVNGSPHERGCTFTALSEVSGALTEEVRQDEEGLQIMRVLGRNMAWFLKLKEAGEKAGVPLPAQEETRTATNFIR